MPIFPLPFCVNNSLHLREGIQIVRSCGLIPACTCKNEKMGALIRVATLFHNLPVRISNLDLLNLHKLSYSLLHPAYILLAAICPRSTNDLNVLTLPSSKCFASSIFVSRMPSDVARCVLFPAVGVDDGTPYFRSRQASFYRWTSGRPVRPVSKQLAKAGGKLITKNEAEVAPLDSYIPFFSVLCMSSDSFKYVRRRFNLLISQKHG